MACLLEQNLNTHYYSNFTMKPLKEVIRKYALQNAIKFNGKANPGAVIGKVLSENSKLNPKDVAKEVMAILKQVNKLSKNKQEAELKSLAPSLLKEKKK